MKGEEGGFKQKLESIRQEVIEFTKQFPVPGIS
jgi:hypothetical protein